MSLLGSGMSERLAAGKLTNVRDTEVTNDNTEVPLVTSTVVGTTMMLVMDVPGVWTADFPVFVTNLYEHHKCNRSRSA
jgi:hypothetical protein